MANDERATGRGAANPRTKTLVVVDDDLEILEALSRAFRDEPYEVLATGDPFMALSWIKSRAVDVVIADEFMPAMQGLELLEATKRCSPKTASIVLTGYPDRAVAGRGRAPQADLILAKPWQDGPLRETVRRLLGAPDPPPTRRSKLDPGAGRRKPSGPLGS